MKPRTWVLTGGAGLALADASIVTLALPELLPDLGTTVVGVAAVIGVYTLVLALALLPAERLLRRWGAARVAAAGFAVFAAASIACAASASLAVLLVARAVQAAGGAAGLVAAFALIDGGAPAGRRHWLGAAVLSSAIGPALGGILTQAFDWRAIFIVQAPVAVAAVAAALAAERAAGGRVLSLRVGSAPADRAGDAPADRAGGAAADRAGGAEDGRMPDDRRASARPQATGPARHGAVRQDPVRQGPARQGQPAAALALALLSAALTAVVFLLVLLLVAGWAVSPIGAAATVTVLPLAALLGARIHGGPRERAIGGALLVAAGVLALAWLPTANVAWTLLPQALAGVGMGMALPAFAGELLPERTTRDAARLLTIRHLGIAAVLAALAPIAAHQLTVSTERAKEQGVALVLDAQLPPQDKITLAPALLAGVEAQQPRAGLRAALATNGGGYTGQQRAAYDTLAHRTDATLIAAVSAAFKTTFLVTGALALLAAAALALSAATSAATAPARAGRRVVAALTAALVLAVATPAAYAALHHARAPAPVALANPCNPRPLPGAGGIAGFIQDRALQALDATACRLHSTREELVLALANEGEAKRFQQRHGVNPRSIGSLLGGLLGGP